jgi:hypothetical protein
MRLLDNRRKPRENGSQLGAAFEDLTRDEEDDRRSSGGGIAMTFTLSRLAPGSYDVLLNTRSAAWRKPQSGSVVLKCATQARRARCVGSA